MSSKPLIAYDFHELTPLPSFWSQSVHFALSSLTGSASIDKNPGQLSAATCQVVDLWRDRIKQLGQLNCEWFNNYPKRVYAMNCPPPGFVLKFHGLRACGRTACCPFCWCRYYTAEAYQRIAALCRIRPRAVLHEISSRHTHFASLLEHEPLTTIFRWIRESKGRLVQELLPEAYGSYAFCSVEPGEAGSWILTHNVLAVMPPQAALLTPADLPTPELLTMQIERRFQRHTLEADKAYRLAAIVGRATLYPATLLTGPLDDLLSLLAARNRGRRAPRMADFYGQLRSLQRELRYDKLNADDQGQAAASADPSERAGD